jgi:sterol desaturase/sphingolipid hydroxylase (fatty acid hydroxylase superfamily)
MIAGEAWLSGRMERDVYDRRDAWTNIFLGFGSLAWGALFGFFTGYAYLYLYGLAPFKFPADAWWSWAALFVLDDFAYYWFHRVSHRSRFFWNFHVVHHSSERYNLSVAVRQSWFSGVAHWVFYAPIMLVGFAPWMFLTMHGFNLLYQFWIHTPLVRKLGVFETFLNTPSHHRVHHGVNEPYLDRNYAGVLIIWDRMFSSFVEESETPRYGIIKQITTRNLLRINTHGWTEMFDEMKRRDGIFEKARCLFGPPDMIPRPDRQLSAAVR